MDTVKLSIEEREQTGNGPARRLRAEGRLPAVLYSKGTESKAISVSADELRAAIVHHGHNVILELDPDAAAKPAKAGTKKKAVPHFAVVKEIQLHPTKRNLLHVDLLEVDLAVEIESQVAIELVGTPAGIEDGGVVDLEHREVTVRALPSDIPDAIVLDISSLQIGQHLSVEALEAPAGTKILDDPQIMVVALVPPRVEQVAEVTEVAEVAEPEVIGGVKSEE
jgi:large subunit ribosomal protein L25